MTSASEKSWNGKGIVESIYHFLWSKDPVFRTVPKILIPDTIIYRFDEPRSWFFINKKTEALQKKNMEKLNAEQISKSFLKKVPESGVVAVFFFKYTDEKGSTKVVFHYFDPEEFKNFIHKRNKPNNGNGILQKFIQPKGEHNFVIKATWSPNLCFFEKRETIKKVNDIKYDIYERLFTYEAEEYHSRHVSNVSFERIQIQRIVLNFKIDENDNIWLLYCSLMKSNTGNSKWKISQEFSRQIYDTDIKEEVPPSINAFNFSVIRPLNFRKTNFCYNCETAQVSTSISFVFGKDKQNVFEISFKTIIECYEENHRVILDEEKININEEEFQELNDDIGNRLRIIKEKNKNKLRSTIPSLILALFPKIKLREFELLSKNPGFLKTVTTVCQFCFLKIIKNSKVGGEGELKNPKKLEQFNIVGTGMLVPEKTKPREKVNSIKDKNSLKVESEGLRLSKIQKQKAKSFSTNVFYGEENISISNEPIEDKLKRIKLKATLTDDTKEEHNEGGGGQDKSMTMKPANNDQSGEKRGEGSHSIASSSRSNHQRDEVLPDNLLSLIQGLEEPNNVEAKTAEEHQDASQSKEFDSFNESRYRDRSEDNFPDNKERHKFTKKPFYIPQSSFNSLKLLLPSRFIPQISDKKQYTKKKLSSDSFSPGTTQFQTSMRISQNGSLPSINVNESSNQYPIDSSKCSEYKTTKKKKEAQKKIRFKSLEMNSRKNESLDKLIQADEILLDSKHSAIKDLLRKKFESLNSNMNKMQYTTFIKNNEISEGISSNIDRKRYTIDQIRKSYKTSDLFSSRSLKIV